MAQALLWVADTVSAYALDVTGSTVLADAIFVATAAVEFAAINAAVGALAPKTPGPEAMHATVRQSIPQRRRGCGHTRMGGALLVDTAFGNVLHMVIAFADCKTPNIDAYYLHQDEVTLTANTVNKLPNGAYDNDVKIYTQFGVTGTTAFSSTLHTEQPGLWPSNCYGTGISLGYLRCESPKLQYFAQNFPHGPQPQLNIVADCNVFFDWRDDTQSQTDDTTWKSSANPVVVLVNELFRYRGYDWTLDFVPTLSILTAEANVCDESVPRRVNLTKLTQNAAAGATTVHLKNVDGLASGMTIYIAGQSFTVSGSPSSDGVGGYAVGLSGSLSVSAATGAVARWTSDPDTPVTRPRYAAHGQWNCGETESDTVKRLLACMDGFMVRRPVDGAVVILAGHWIEPVVTLGADEIIDYTYTPFPYGGRVVNQLACAFVSPAHDYVQVDTSVWQDDADISARGQAFSQPFAPELVQENSQVLRLAKAAISRSLVNIEQLKLKASGIRLLGDETTPPSRWFRAQMDGESVTEYADVVFELAPDGGDIEIVDNGMHVVVPVRRADPNLYAWDYLTEEGDGPPDAPTPIVAPLAQPAITSATAFFDTATDGSQGVRITIAATGPARSDLTWFYRWRKSGDTSWFQASDASVSGGSVTLATGFVVANATIEVEVACQTGGGTLSDWSATTNVSTSTASIAPGPVTSPAAATGTAAGEIDLSWRDPTSANFDHMVMRRSLAMAMTSPTTVLTRAGSPGQLDSYTDTGLTTGTTYYYDFTAYNASGTPSTATTPVSAVAA